MLLIPSFCWIFFSCLVWEQTLGKKAPTFCTLYGVKRFKSPNTFTEMHHHDYCFKVQKRVHHHSMELQVEVNAAWSWYWLGVWEQMAESRVGEAACEVWSQRPWEAKALCRQPLAGGVVSHHPLLFHADYTTKSNFISPRHSNWSQLHVSETIRIDQCIIILSDWSQVRVYLWTSHMTFDVCIFSSFF